MINTLVIGEHSPILCHFEAGGREISTAFGCKQQSKGFLAPIVARNDIVAAQLRKSCYYKRRTSRRFKPPCPDFGRKQAKI